MMHSENLEKGHDLVPRICSLDEIENDDSSRKRCMTENKNAGMKVGRLENSGQSNNELDKLNINT